MFIKYLRKLIARHLKLISVFIILSASLSSCGWHQCRATSKILDRRVIKNKAILPSKRFEVSVSRINSDLIINRVIDKLQLKDADGQILTNKELRKSLVFDPIENTDVMAISYRYRNKRNSELANNVVNSLMEVYFEEFPILPKKLPQLIKELSQKELMLYNIRQNRHNQQDSVTIIEYAKSSCSQLGYFSF